MKKCMLIGLICLLSSQWMWGQHFPQMDARNYVSDTALFIPRRPWLAASEVFGMNMAVWTFDRFLMNEDFAKINGHTIKQNFKTGPVWDTDKFSTNLVAHPYHGSLYFNAARSNGLNFWQSIPFAAGGSLMWEFFMETEPPSINDMLATSFGGIELGEITYRLSDLFIDNRSHGAERVGREILSGLISPMRAINRIITGEAWRHSSSKGRVYTSVPVNFIVGVGPRFLAEQEGSKHGTTSMHVSFRLDYGDPFNDDFYSPYEWFQLKAGFRDGVSYEDLYQRLLFGVDCPADQYLLLADFASYCAASQRVTDTYRDREKWNRMSLHNIARSGIFSADRSVADYADTIWHVPYKK